MEKRRSSHSCSEWRVRLLIPKIVAFVLVFSGLFYVLASVLVALLNPTWSSALRNVGHMLDLNVSRRLGGMVGLLFGCYLIFLGQGLFHCYRTSWRAAVVTLCILVANSFLLSSMPAAGYLSLVLLLALLLTRRLFKEHPEYDTANSKQVIALFSVLFAVSYGVIGSYLLRQEFRNLNTLTDAVYYTFVTFSTVGFGDITPVSQNAKYFTVSMILIGLGSFATALSFIVGPMVEQRMKGVLRMMKKIYDMKNHVILCSYTPLTAWLIRDLQKQGTSFLVIEDRPDRLAELQRLGLWTVPGRSTQRETLRQAGLSHANTVVCAYDEDADNILTILTVKELQAEQVNTKLKLIVRVDQEENVDKARTLNVDHIVSPASLAAQAMMDIVVKPSV